MCGICGVYKIRNGNEGALRAAVKKMNESQDERGPDDKGIETINDNPAVIFGHSRLSILDLSPAGHQPMIWQIANRKSQIAITFNGEIYNFLELRKELEKKGYKFKTQTDTEVILALYAEYGEKSFLMLRGMFAFALWDDKNKKLFLVKDRYGIKPLYYYGDDDKFVFASMVKVIEKSGLIPVKKNQKALIGFLLFGFVPLPIATVENVFGVPAGHYLEISEGGIQRLVEYYDPLKYFLIKSKDDFEVARGKIKVLLEDSVKHHLISDAPLGVFLSGGLDSSALAAIAASHYADQSRFERGLTQINKNLITLSIVFDEKEFSEQKYQRLVAEKIKSDHREIKITSNDFEASFDEIFKAMDQPTIDGVNSFFVAKAAKQAGLKAVLSGLGADEIFLGYSHFHRAELFKKIQKLPKILKLPLKLSNLFGDKYSKLSHFANDDILSFYLGIRGIFAPKEVAKILDINLSEVENFINNLAKLTNLQTYKLKNLHPVDLLSYLELKFYLQNQLLKDTDFMSMHHSIEVRVPFLDYALVEYLSSLPAEIKLKSIKALKHENIKTREHKVINKLLLVEAIWGLLPEEIFTRPKMGFIFPFQKWFKKSAKRLLIGDLRLAGKHWSRFWAGKVIKIFNL